MLHLLCPGLLDPSSGPPPDWPRLPTLARMLARADRSPIAMSAPDPLAAALQAAEVRWDSWQDPPTAPFALRGEGIEAAETGYWLHADPVHLRPDQTRLRLFPGGVLVPDPAEARALAAAFNVHFAGEGLQLLAPAPERWYLRLERDPQLRNHSLATVAGRTIGGRLPVGADAGQWMRRLNETQMLFFAHPVNQARERLGRPTINGLWIWGGGRLPEPAAGGPDWLAGDHPLTRGLARWRGQPWCSLDDWCSRTALTPGTGLIYWDRPGTGWAALDAALEPIMREVRAGRISRLILDTGTQRFLATSRTERRFWRRAVM